MSLLRAQSPRTLAALMLFLAAARATAQCPNGRPPPCQQGTPAARHVNPALNPRSWIVVPFANVTKTPDIDWLRDASVNLLSMDMGRWTDVDVVSDKRVADLVRELPAGKRNESLSLNDGLAIAQRAGAAMLVMGDVFKAGAGARIVANVFDVRTGARVRTYTQQVPVSDSLLGAFGPVARGVLAIPPPADAKTGDVGTTKLDAYQAYLLGTRALYRHNLEEARTQLQRAMSLDSTFALAHLEYSFFLTWGEPTGVASESRRHALIAQQLGTSLPKRDRMLIEAQIAYGGQEYSHMCEISRALVSQDSTDIEALNMLGECSFHDNSVEPLPTDSITGRFRNSWNTSIWAFTRVLELDPAYLGAFEHVFDILQSVGRGGTTCPRASAPINQCVKWVAVTLRSGDSLVTIPTRAGAKNNAEYFAQQERAQKEHARAANLEIAQGIAQRWVDADVTSETAHLAMARVAAARGNVAEADKELRRVSMRATQDNYQALRLKMEVEAKQGHGAVARALFDSLVKAVPDNPSIDALRGSMELLFGRMKRFDRGGATAAARLGPEAVAYQQYVSLSVLGLPQPGLARAESLFVASMQDPACNRSCRFSRLTPTLAYALHVPTIPAAVLDSAEQGDARLTIAAALVTGDTARLRSAALNQEENARENVAELESEFGWSLIAADSYLRLRDSTNALRLARFFVDSAMAFAQIMGGGSGIVSTGTAFVWPRAMLLRADLAKAMGFKAEARTWYLRVLDLWADADPALQPVIVHIRTSLAALDTKA